MYGSNVCSRIPRWESDSIEWLGELFGKLDIAGMTKPVCPPKVDMNHSPMLSVHCTLRHLRSQEAAMPVLASVIAQIDSVERARFGDNKGVFEMLDNYKLYDMLSLLALSPEEIAALDEQLNAIPNRF